MTSKSGPACPPGRFHPAEHEEFMATCNRVLQDKGENYPRTCAKCRLGPCQDYRPDQAPAQLKAIAGLIQKLSYRDMLTFGEHIAKALEGRDGYKAADIVAATLAASDGIIGHGIPVATGQVGGHEPLDFGSNANRQVYKR